LPSDNPTHHFLDRFRHEQAPKADAPHHARRAHLTRATGPIAHPIHDWAAELLGEPAVAATPAPGAAPGQPSTARSSLPMAVKSTGSMAHPRSLDRSHSRLAWRGKVGRKGLIFSVIAVILIVSAVAASLPLYQPSSGGSGATTAAALSPDASATNSSPTPSASPTPTGSPTPQPTLPPRTGVPIPGTAFLAYQVRAGDTLYRIAQSFGLAVTTLYWANSGTVSDPQLVKIGQGLVVPPVDGLVMTTTATDTLKSIADKYGIDPQVIMDANQMTADQTLTGGQLLLVPGVATGPLPVPIIPAVVPKPPNWLGKLYWPVPGHHKITLVFGCVTYAGEPRYGRCPHFHGGLDIGAPRGTVVIAAATGTVIYAGWRKAGTDGAAGGIVVWMSHGGTLYTTYNHLSGVTVKAGQRVAAGQQIGMVGATGAASGAHLHFEVWSAFPWTGGGYADAKNPLLYIRK
jgi:murein DD-endopeptidase MepM/ murein hydrolase activator NlpD